MNQIVTIFKHNPPLIWLHDGQLVNSECLVFKDFFEIFPIFLCIVAHLLAEARVLAGHQVWGILDTVIWDLQGRGYTK